MDPSIRLYGHRAIVYIAVKDMFRIHLRPPKDSAFPRDPDAQKQRTALTRRAFAIPKCDCGRLWQGLWVHNVVMFSSSDAEVARMWDLNVGCGMWDVSVMAVLDMKAKATGRVTGVTGVTGGATPQRWFWDLSQIPIAYSAFGFAPVPASFGH
jgi:hypothetical protein